VRRVIDEWLLVEYACVFLPANQSALVEAVSKGASVPEPVLRALGFDPAAPRVIPFTPVEEIGKEFRRHLERPDVRARIAGRIQEAYDAARGRV
jgi:hypothetical protein